MPRRVSLAWPDRARPSRAARALSPGVGGDGVALVRGDGVDALAALAAGGVRAALVYIDPPFFTQRVHHTNARERRDSGKRAAFSDEWADLGAYLEHLDELLVAARAVLAPEGSLVLHTDPRVGHYLRVLGDEVFGEGAFASEIVWRYRRWPAKTRNFQRVHDLLLRFVRAPAATPRFHQRFEPLAPSTARQWGAGRQRALFVGGRRARSTSTDEPSPGAPLGDVWDISIVAPSGRERTGYPTQKPLALLERLVETLTDPGDLVIDPTMGSGTALLAAWRLGRRAIGVDVSGVAHEVSERRLSDHGVPFRTAEVSG